MTTFLVEVNCSACGLASFNSCNKSPKTQWSHNRNLFSHGSGGQVSEFSITELEVKCWRMGEKDSSMPFPAFAGSSIRCSCCHIAPICVFIFFPFSWVCFKYPTAFLSNDLVIYARFPRIINLSQDHYLNHICKVCFSKQDKIKRLQKLVPSVFRVYNNLSESVLGRVSWVNLWKQAQDWEDLVCYITTH